MTQRDPGTGQFIGERGVIAMRGWPGGLRRGDGNIDLTSLSIEELAVADNVLIGPRGEIVPRPGITESATTFSATVQDILPVGDTAGNSFTLLVTTADHASGAGLYLVSSDGSYVDKLTAEQDRPIPLLHPDGDTMFITGPSPISQTEVDLTTNPTGKTALTEWDPSSGDTLTNFPAADAGDVAYDRFFVAGVLNSPKNRIFFSEVLAFKDWKTTSFIDVGADDGIGVQAIVYFAEQILIFFKHSVWAIYGTDFETGNLEVEQLTAEFGLSNPGLIASVRQAVFFVDGQEGVVAFDGSAFQKVGEPVWGLREFDTDFTPTMVGSGGFLFITTQEAQDDAKEVWVMDLDRGIWTRWTGAFGQMCPALPGETVLAHVAGGTDHLGIGSIDRYTKYYDGSKVWDDWGDTAITCTVRTGWIQPAGGLLNHRTRLIEVRGVDSARTITLNAYKDLDTVAAAATTTLDFSNEGNEAGSVKTHAVNGFRWMALSLEITWTIPTATTVDGFRLAGINLEVSALPRRRGS